MLVTTIWGGQVATPGNKVGTSVRLGMQNYTDSDLVINMLFSEALDGIWQPLRPALRTGAWRRFFLTTVKLNRETWRSVVSCLADMISTALQT